MDDFDVVCTLDGSHGVLPPVRAVRLDDLPERVVPAFERRTAPAGPFAVLARHDLATGPRHVRGLRSVELHKLW